MKKSKFFATFLILLRLSIHINQYKLKKMKKTTALLMAIVIVMSCQKKNSNSNSQNSTQSATTGSTTSATTNLSLGVMQVSNNQGSGGVVCEFHDATGTKINIGTVKINDTIVPWQSNNYGNGGWFYILSTNYLFNGIPTWKISGGNGVPSTTISAKSIPVAPLSITTSTIYESQSFTFTHTPLYCDSIFYAFGNYTVMTVGTNTSMTIPSIAVVSTSTWQTSVGGSIGLYNYNFQTIGTIPCKIISFSSNYASFPYQQ